MNSIEKLDYLLFKCAFSEYDNVDEFIELHIKQSSDYEATYNDLNKLERIKIWFDNIDKFNIRDKYYAIPKDFIDLAKVVLEDENC